MKYIPFILIAWLLPSCSNAQSGKKSGPDANASSLANEAEEMADPLQKGDNANTRANKYTGYFLYGSNMQWYNENWSDEDIAGILVGNERRNWEGAGVTSLRPALYEDFVETYGYDIRLNAFQYYTGIGTKNNVVFIGDRPSDQHRERKQYIPGVPSESYENLYEPVWDNGENGTPVNDKNYYALYVYKVVQRYKNNVKFWEIKNEPDFTYSPDCAHNGPDGKCNWWDKDPDPELLVNLHAPIQSYIRMLRVAYEIIKSVDPDAFICVGGIGYESFLDAILRNTDNPDGGKVTAEYPHKGGAWFDCLSYHIYPMYYLKNWSGLGFRYSRYSDAAVDAVVRQNSRYIDLLKKYGYDGVKYPAKEIIITETNVPNKRVGDYIGSEQAQRNFLVKMAVVAQRNNISGIYPFCPIDFKEWNENGEEYDYKGFYRPIPDAPGSGQLRIHESGTGWRTVSRTLNDRKYDAIETARLNLPETIDGSAFYSTATKDYVYVFWAKTNRDLSETASAAFTFPASMNVTKMASTSWDERETAIGGNTVKLTGDPVFVRLNVDVTPKPVIPVSGITLSKTSGTIETGNTLQLTANISPYNAKNRKATWTSSNPAIARVDNLGAVTAVAPGKTIITVKTEDGNRTATCNITVLAEIVNLSYILVEPGYINMKAGDAGQLQVEFFPANATNRNIIWKSSNENIVTVDRNGKLKAVAPGKVNITVTPEGEDSKAKNCIVQVD
ncbi:MAG: Ig-like domain-containing protein [Bacteroidales bacterium]|jgi:uncharacterized protein YjdB|nr:Ig-like domain-containing protein [Bacteroidales bacterium]